MPLRPDKSVGIVQVVFDLPYTEKGYALPLPSAEYFRGVWVSGQRERLSVEMLNRATVDYRGNVTLANGDTLRAIEIEPARSPRNPTMLDWRIVHIALRCCWTAENAPFTEREVREKCYPPY